MPSASRACTSASTRGRRRRRLGRRGLWRGVVVALAGVVSTWGFVPESLAELVVLTDGRFIKVTAFERIGERMRLELPVGGQLTLALSRVERIVDDEIVEGAGFAVRMPIVFDFEEDAVAPETPYGDLIFETAERHSLNPELVAAVVAVESAFRPDAVSPKGAMGLMQLMPATASRFGVDPSNAFEPSANLDGGVRYLRWLGGRFPDDLPKVLAAYNAGEGNVDRYDGVPPFRETQNYVQKVYARLGLEPALALPDASPDGGE